MGQLILLIAEEDFAAAKEAEEEWEAERWSHFWDDFRVFEWLNFIIDGTLFYFVMKPWVGVD